MGRAKSPRERQLALERFQAGCRRALETLSGPGPTDAEHNELARQLGRPDLVRELQDELPIGPGAA